MHTTGNGSVHEIDSRDDGCGGVHGACGERLRTRRASRTLGKYGAEPTAEHRLHRRDAPAAAVVRAILFRQGERRAAHLTARDDRHLVDRVCVFLQVLHDRVTRFMIRNSLPVFLTQKNWPFRTKNDFFKRVHEVFERHRFLIPAGRQQCRFIYQVA